MEVRNLKVKVVCKKELQKELEERLKKAGFQISMDADFVLKEVDYKQLGFLGQKDDAYTLIAYQDIVYIEAFDHDVFLKTMSASYKIKEKLYEIALLLEDEGFVRINKSQVVNIKAIMSMIPSFNSRMNILMKNKDMLYVSRNYLANFKESIGFK